MPAAVKNPYGIYEVGGNGDHLQYCSNVPVMQNTSADMDMVEPAFVKRRRLV